LVDQYTAKFPEAKKAYKDLISNQPDGNTYDLPKKSLHVMIKDSAEMVQMNKLSNRLIQIAGESECFCIQCAKIQK
jgi:hypothetical protein